VDISLKSFKRFPADRRGVIFSACPRQLFFHRVSSFSTSDEERRFFPRPSIRPLPPKPPPTAALPDSPDRFWRLSIQYSSNPPPFPYSLFGSLSLGPRSFHELAFFVPVTPSSVDLTSLQPLFWSLPDIYRPIPNWHPKSCYTFSRPLLISQVLSHCLTRFDFALKTRPPFGLQNNIFGFTFSPPLPLGLDFQFYVLLAKSLLSYLIVF